MACSGEGEFTSVLGAVEAGAGCAGDRCAVSLDRSSAHCWGLFMPRKRARPKPRTEFDDGVSS